MASAPPGDTGPIDFTTPPARLTRSARAWTCVLAGFGRRASSQSTGTPNNQAGRTLRASTVV